MFSHYATFYDPIKAYIITMWMLLFFMAPSLHMRKMGLASEVTQCAQDHTAHCGGKHTQRQPGFPDSLSSVGIS